MNDAIDTLPSEEVQELASNFRMVGNMAELFASLAKARLEFKPIVKDKTVKVRPYNGDPYEFTYAPLENIIEATYEALGKYGLVLMQPPPSARDGYALHTMLCHSSGAYISSTMEIAGTVEYWDKQSNPPGWRVRKVKIQELGSELTYKRRYAVQCLLGVSAEDDDDGNAADGNEAKPVERPKQQPPAPQKKQQPKAAPPPEQPKPAPEPEVPTETLAVPPTELPPSDGVGIMPEAEPETEVMATKETNAAIKKVFQQFRFNKDGATKFCADVTKKAPADLTENDAQRLLTHLRDGGFLTQWLSANKQATQ